MTRHVQFRLVDAFADGVFRGNPAGVVLDADGLSDEQMQAIAGEVHASETAFIEGGNDLHRPLHLRWFTPTVEVGFCGHATLAAAHAWSEIAGLRSILARSDAALTFETAAGLLTLRPEPLPKPAEVPLWWLDMPDPQLKRDNTNPIKLRELLGLAGDDLEPAAPIMRTRDDDLIVLIRSWRTLMELRPDLRELARLSERFRIRGVCVATLDTLNDFTNVASRFFAPACGVDEDPVTGSIHGPLAVMLVVTELIPLASGSAALHCVQGIPGGRTGMVRALVKQTPQGYRVSIAGCCHTTIRGEIRVPQHDG